MSTRLTERLAPIRVRVTLAASLAVALVLFLASLALVDLHRGELIDSLDNTLRLRVDEVATDVLSGNVELGTNPARDGEVGLLQIVTEDGVVISATANAAGDPSIAAVPPEGDVEIIRSVPSLPIDDDRFRILSRTLDSDRGRLVIHAAASLDPIDENVADLRAALWQGLPVVVALLALMVWVLVGRTLRPIEAIRAEVATIGGTDLDRRVPTPRAHDEVGRLARTMNGLLDRIEQASLRQRQFVADASHELRSPLTRMRSELEVDLAHPRDADLAATHRSVLDETVQLQRLVEDLLELARSDEGLGPPTMQVVDLDDLVLAEGRRLRDGGRVQVDTTRVSAGQVRGDRDQLRRAVRNLADNAGRHATGSVAFALTETNGTVVLTVTDDGPGIPPDAREHVFERFSRLDPSRARPDGGTGLGLAIVKDVVLAHGGRVTIDPDHTPGARFVVELPAMT